MTFVSYAQNFEDVMLWRALQHIKRGFYIDVGAWSPDADSVTRAFYERDWRGINVEPNSALHKQLLQRRPRDINLSLAVSDSEGRLSMSFLTNSGLSTLDSAIAQRHLREGSPIERQAPVQVVTLNTVWRLHVPANQEVHFLKVDVEGLEDAVLRGKDWSSGRPWIVVVEATHPMSQTPSHSSWEPILLDARYQFVYADGLNRYYVASEHAELANAFIYPPNVFDGFESVHRATAEKLAAEATSRAQIAENRKAVAENRAKAAEAQFAAIEASLSWRLTAPLREASRFVSTTTAQAKRAARHYAVATLKSIGLFECVRTAVRRSPTVGVGFLGSTNAEATTQQLSPEARQIYRMLIEATNKKEKID